MWTCQKYFDSYMRLYSNINVYFFLIPDTSKKRHCIRKKLSGDKLRLAKLVKQYNELAHIHPDLYVITDEQQQEGAWPWFTQNGLYLIVYTTSCFLIHV